MKISYNWLKTLIDTNLTPEQMDEYLTSSGLEVEGIESFESIKGGLQGIVIGEVVEKEQRKVAGLPSQLEKKKSREGGCRLQKMAREEPRAS